MKTNLIELSDGSLVEYKEGMALNVGAPAKKKHVVDGICDRCHQKYNVPTLGFDGLCDNCVKKASKTIRFNAWEIHLLIFALARAGASGCACNGEYETLRQRIANHPENQ
jgi:hypothetical protein